MSSSRSSADSGLRQDVAIFESLVPWRARSNFRKDLFISAFGGLWIGGTPPFAAFVARDHFHASGTELSIIAAGPFVGSLLALPLTHTISSGRPVRNVALWYTVARVFLVLAALATGGLWFALAVFAVNCLSAIPFPTHATILRLIYPPRFIGRLLSYTRVVLVGGMILATFLSGVLMDVIGWRWVFALYAPFGFAALYIYSLIRIPLQQPAAPEGSPGEFVLGALRLVKEDVGFRFFAMAVFVYGFGNLMIIPVLTIYQVDYLHISSRWISILTNVSQIVWMLSYVFWGRLTDSISPLKIVLVNSLLGLIIPWNHILATQVWMLLPMAVTQGVINAGIELSYFNSVMHFSSPHNAVQYQGMHSLLLGVRGIIAPFVGSGLAHALRLRGGDIRWVFVLGSIFVLLGSALQWYGLRHPARGTLIRHGGSR